MSVEQRTIAKNTGFYIAALTIQKILSFGYFSYLARSIGAEQTGHYFFALSIAAVSMVLMDLGLTPLLTREVAKRTDQSSEITGAVFSIKIVLTMLLGIAYAVFVPIAIADPLVQQLIYIAFLISIMDTFSMTFFATVRGHQNLFYESIASMIFFVIVIVFGVSAIHAGADLRLIIAALLIASGVNTAISYLVLRRKFFVRISFSLAWPYAKKLMMLAWPFALAAIFTKVQAYVDTIMLNFLSGAAEVGLYGVAYKITFAFQFIPLAFVAALYPAYSYYWQHSQEKLNESFVKASQYLLLLALPITAGIIALAPAAIPHIYTESFTGSVLPLIVLLASLPLLFLNFPVGALLNACNRQSRQTVHLGIGMVLSIILNILLIPRYEAVGAALASSITTVAIFCLGSFVIRGFSHVRLMPVMITFAQLIVISAVMYGIVVLLLGVIPWYLTIIPAALFYGTAVLTLRIVTIPELLSIKALLRR